MKNLIKGIEEHEPPLINPHGRNIHSVFECLSDMVTWVRIGSRIQEVNFPFLILKFVLLLYIFLSWGSAFKWLSDMSSSRGDISDYLEGDEYKIYLLCAMT